MAMLQKIKQEIEIFVLQGDFWQNFNFFKLNVNFPQVALFFILKIYKIIRVISSMFNFKK